MTGGHPPYTARSPTQQQQPSHFYSPSSKNPPYYSNNEHYQHPPHTPPFPPPPALARSPQYGHPSSPLNTTLPPLNGAAPSHPPHSDSSPQYHGHSNSTGPPQFPVRRPYSESILSTNTSTPPGPYGHSTPSHAHPGSRPDNLSQSPKRDMDMPFNMIQGRGNGYSSQSPMAREQRPPSPKETVRLITIYILFDS